MFPSSTSHIQFSSALTNTALQRKVTKLVSQQDASVSCEYVICNNGDYNNKPSDVELAPFRAAFFRKFVDEEDGETKHLFLGHSPFTATKLSSVKDIPPNCVVSKLYEGTMVVVAFDPLREKWQVFTRHGAGMHFHYIHMQYKTVEGTAVYHTKRSFREMLAESWGYSSADSNVAQSFDIPTQCLPNYMQMVLNINPTSQIFFVGILQHPAHPLVHECKTPFFVVVDAYKVIDNKLGITERILFPTEENHFMQTSEDATKLTRGWYDVKSPVVGVFAYDMNGNTFVVKNKGYLKLHELRGNDTDLLHDFLERKRKTKLIKLNKNYMFTNNNSAAQPNTKQQHHKPLEHFLFHFSRFRNLYATFQALFDLFVQAAFDNYIAFVKGTPLHHIVYKTTSQLIHTHLYELYVKELHQKLQQSQQSQQSQQDGDVQPLPITVQSPEDYVTVGKIAYMFCIKMRSSDLSRLMCGRGRLQDINLKPKFALRAETPLTLFPNPERVPEEKKDNNIGTSQKHEPLMTPSSVQIKKILTNPQKQKIAQKLSDLEFAPHNSSDAIGAVMVYSIDEETTQPQQNKVTELLAMKNAKIASPKQVTKKALARSDDGGWICVGVHKKKNK